MKPLLQVIDGRVRSIVAGHPEWPCRKGCDTCCRRLAAIPQLTVPELELLSAGFDGLAVETRARVIERMEGLPADPPFVCPFLEDGACLVYEHRPVACRTYGFYVERDKGLFCGIIEGARFEDVVWGNHASVERELEQLGPRVWLPEWFSSREPRPHRDTTARSRA